MNVKPASRPSPSPRPRPQPDKQKTTFCQKDNIILLCVYVMVAIGAVVVGYSISGSSAVIDDVGVLVPQSLLESKREWPVTCVQKDYLPRLPGCSPTLCKRVVRDDIFSKDEADRLLRFLLGALPYGRGSGGPTIFDVHQGVLSFGDKFIDFYNKLKSLNVRPFTKEEVAFVRSILLRIKSAVESEFGVTGATPHIVNDEYWHPHVDKVAYGSFVYTSLIYLSDYGTDFTGGQFQFLDRTSNTTIEPRKGRLSIFTSGSENLHRVRRLTSGTRYALTVAFTCDSDKGVPDHDIMSKASIIFPEL